MENIKSFANRSNARRAAKAAGIPAEEIIILTLPGGYGFQRKTEDARTLTIDGVDHGLVPASTAKAEARKLAKETGKTVMIFDPVTDELLEEVKPRAAKAPKAQKPAKAPKAPKAPKEPKAPRTFGTGDKIAEVLRLAKRPEGASRKELIAATGWDKAPWRWNFQNPKGTGYSQKLGLPFRTEKVEGEQRYFLG